MSENLNTVAEGEVNIRTTTMGRDIIFLVSGGEAHIGAVATAYWSNENKIIVETQSLPGHREVNLAMELAEMGSLALGCTVTTLVGIHLNNPSKQEIDAIVSEARRSMEQILYHWKEV